MPSNSKKIIIQLLLAVILLGAAGFLVYKNFVKEEKSYVLMPGESKKQELTAFEEVIKIFERSEFKNLIKFGNWPVKVLENEKGRTNPFLEI